MKCQFCGAEIDNGATTCKYCGQVVNNKIIKKAALENSNAVFESDSTKLGSENNSRSDDKENTVPWYFRMWFISIVFWGGSFLFGLGPIAAVVLYILRMTKYPKSRKKALLSGGIQIGLLVLLLVWAFYDAGAYDRAINKYLAENDIEGAKKYISDHYNASSYSYYQKMADLYEDIGDYDMAANTILDYCGICDLSKAENDVVDRLMKYKPRVNAEISQRIEKINTDIVKAKSDREALEKATEQAETEAEQAKAEAEQAKADAKKAQDEATQAKADTKSAQDEATQTKADSNKNEQTDTNPNYIPAKEETTEDVSSYFEGDPGDMEDISLGSLSASELKNFMRDKSNIGTQVTFTATVIGVDTALLGGYYMLRLSDGTAVYGFGIDDSLMILEDDSVTYTGIYEGIDNPTMNGWPYFTTISIEIN